MRQFRQSFQHLRVGGSLVTHNPPQKPQLQPQPQPQPQQITRSLSTGCISHKAKTIGTMSWVRSARRRKFLMLEMANTEKKEHTITREEILARQKPEIRFQTTIRDGRTELDESVMEQLNVTPSVFLSRDRKTIVCYHPPGKNYPIEFTKPAMPRPPRDYPDPRVVDETYRNSLSEEEVEEGKRLVDKDPWLWSPVALANMFQVRLEAIEEQLLPLTPEQQRRYDAESEVFWGMSGMKKRNVEKLNAWERNKYIQTREGYVAPAPKLERPRIPRPPKF